MKLFIMAHSLSLYLEYSFSLTSLCGLNKLLRMSQYISVPQAPYQCLLEPREVLQGILSNIIEPTRGTSKDNPSFKETKSCGNFWQTNSKAVQEHFDAKVDKRYVQQVKIADQIQNSVLTEEYQKMKKQLLSYGKSSVAKMQKMMGVNSDIRKKQKQGNLKSKYLINKPRNRLSVKQAEEKNSLIKRYSVGNNSYTEKTVMNSRTVFVDRIYNRQFAIKMSSLIEADKIRIQKQQKASSLNRHRPKQPLVEDIRKSIKERSLCKINVVKDSLGQRTSLGQQRSKIRFSDLPFCIKKDQKNLGHKLFKRKRFNQGYKSFDLRVSEV